ncbi:MAG: 4-(cytidine 5'-diphospho)-2-C-methyl-D-erythritol kinase [Leptospira sp.]|nr:4-(cytidine 5'-diphospho)-2-C-methyl-D-erythritol kinase [Leptospira sp.]
MLSPAKINLGLKVLFKRPDGFHEINSIFLRINWGDDIRIEVTDTGKFELISSNELIEEKRSLYDDVSEKGDIRRNILFKTFEFSRTLISDLPGVKIHIIKRIPPGGGLGGGSSNAAMLLNFLFHGTRFFMSDELTFLAAKIGADVPFFLNTGNAFVSGIGEKLSKIEVSGGLGILAIGPYSINTREAYISLKKPLQGDYDSKNWNLLDEDSIFALKTGNWKILSGNFENDFEEYAFRAFPRLELIKKGFLANGASFASMTGSGSCIYCLTSSLESHNDVFDRMVREFPDFKFVSFNF